MKWIDPFVVTLLLTMLLATWLPCSGDWSVRFERLTVAAIFLLFFLHGAKLSREALWNGVKHWQLHSATLFMTYVVFPVAGLGLVRFPGLDPALASGLLYLTLLPSTVQSSIAFTSMAKGNVSAAVCAATLSNLLGIFVTPMLVACLMQSDALTMQFSGESIKKIALQLLLPFVLGHLSRPWTGNWVLKHKTWIGRTDRSSILLVVYTAFSSAVVGGLWQKYSWVSLLGLMAISLGLLGGVLCLSRWLSNLLKFSGSDAVVLLFCGSKKSLASGVPMAGVLFAPDQVGLVILPVMIFHQVQLMVCAVIARRMGEMPHHQTSDRDTPRT